MLLPIFTLNLGQKILPGRVTIGEYDGKHPCLTAATGAEKVFIHNPHQRMGAVTGRLVSQQQQDLSILNINQQVLSLAAGRLNDAVNRDTLVIGTPTNLLAHDVENNSDLFYKDVADGANCVQIGRVGSSSRPLAIVGGNCSLQGFDHEGNDPFWTVTGDNVTSLVLTDYNKNGRNELIVGSEDFEIRVFADDEIITEITETESVTNLAAVQEGRFGYALANGTVGVYEKTTRWWRIKSKNQATAIFSFDLDGDGMKELITGWSSGKLDARNDKSGEVVFKDNLSAGVAGVTQGDYRMDGKMELITATTDGEIRGYLPAPADSQRNMMDLNVEQETLRELSSRKQNLLLELKNYEANAAASLGGGGLARAGAAGGGGEVDMGMIPAQTQLQTALAINLGTEGKAPHVEVTLSTSNDTIIKSVLIFAEGIFEGESHVVHPKEVSSTLSIPLNPLRDVPIDLHIKAFVGYKSSTHFHVFELTRQLPRFSMYSLVTADPPPAPPPAPPTGWVTLQAKERVQRIVMWLNQNFLLTEEIEAKQTSLDLDFLVLRNNRVVSLCMDGGGVMTVKTDDMDLAGDIVQSLGTYLGMEDLATTCSFPQEISSLEGLLSRAEELQAVRARLSADMADHSGLIRSLVVRSEDSRIMGDMSGVRRWSQQLYDINRDLVSQYKIRCNNHKELMDTLKEVNQIIQKAARLRIGRSKSTVVNECRSSIKTNNINQLVKVIKTGIA